MGKKLILPPHLEKLNTYLLMFMACVIRRRLIETLIQLCRWQPESYLLWDLTGIRLP